MSNEIQALMQDIGKRARNASRAISRASTEQKNQALLHIAKLVRQKADEIQKINQADVDRAKEKGILEVMAISASDAFLRKLGFDYSLPEQKRALFYQLHARDDIFRDTLDEE